ncbi:MAG: ImmA/IrrE family metallo-endopeptidase [Chloroflexi bacterium]|nr:ImmA/IrrE family metallo-endopeptidase [Chloroflexota bacterium]
MGAASGHTPNGLALRIKKARERVGMTQEDLALRAGLPAPQSMSQIERGERAVKAIELGRIAEALHLSIVDLVTPAPAPAKVLWRNPPVTGQSDAEAKFLERCRNYRLAEQWAAVPAPPPLRQASLPKRLDDYQFAEGLASDIRECYGFGKYPAATLVRTLEEDVGVKLLYEANLEGSAACSYQDFGAAMLINASEVPWRRNYSIAHELFHLVTWNAMPPETLEADEERWPKVETLANVFASALLLPTEAVERRVHERQKNRSLKLIDLIELARVFDVSTEALLWRLANMRLLARRKVEDLLDNPELKALDLASLREYPYREPELVPSRFLNLLVTAYAKGEVSLGRIAEMTGISLVEVRRRLKAFRQEGNLGQAELRVA